MQVKRRALLMYHRSWVRDVTPSPIPAEYSDEVSHGESDRFLTCSDDLSIVEIDFSNQSIQMANTFVATSQLIHWKTFAHLEADRYSRAHQNHILNLELNPFADPRNIKDISMASAGSDCKIVLWRMNAEEKKLIHAATLEGHGRLVRCVRFSAPDTLISCGHDATVRIWDIPSGTLRATLQCSADALDVMDFDLLSPTIVACCCSDGSVKVWDIEKQEIIGSLDSAHTDSVRRVRVLRLPDDNLKGWDAIRSLGAVINHPKTFDEWVGNLSEEQRLKFPGVSLRTRWNTLLVTCSYDATIKVFSLATQKELPLGARITDAWHQLGSFSALEVYPLVGCQHNNALIITGSYDHRVRIWDLNSGNIVRELVGHGGIPCTAKLWRDRIISVGTDGMVYEWTPTPLVRLLVSQLVPVNLLTQLFRAKTKWGSCFSMPDTKTRESSRRSARQKYWINCR